MGAGMTEAILPPRVTPEELSQMDAATKDSLVLQRDAVIALLAERLAAMEDVVGRLKREIGKNNNGTPAEAPEEEQR